MRYCRLAAAFLLLALLLASCAAGNPAVAYDAGECEHSHGAWYDITPLTCKAEGKQIRYCKICRESEERVLPVAEDEARRAHSFSDTVVPPTEAEGGYTSRECTLCGYTVDRADPTPPLYALIANEATVTAVPAGLSGVVLSDTVSHLLSYRAGGDTATDAELARRLAAALAVTDRIDAAELSLSDSITVSFNGTVSPNVFYEGNRVTLEQTLRRWLATGGDDAAAVLAEFLEMTPSQLTEAANARAEKLGLTATAFSSLTAASGFGSTTLYETALLLCRALAEESIAGMLAREAENADVTIAGETPAVWFIADGLRVSALERDGRVYFLLLAGESIAQGAESGFYAGLAG